MDVIVCTEPGDLRLERRPRPIRAEGEVLVRIRKIGVWGTDMHIFTGNQPYLSYPRVMGHELAGKVEEAPAGSGLEPGDPAPRPRPQRISERPASLCDEGERNHSRAGGDGRVSGDRRPRGAAGRE